MEKALNLDFPNWTELSIDTVNFFFAESEKRLKGTITTFTTNKDRAFNLIKFLLPIITISVGFVFSNEKPNPLFIPILVFLAIQIVGIFLLILIILPRTIHDLGSPPSLLIHPEDFTGGNDKDQYVGIVLNQCENLEARINSNKRQNTILARLLTAAIIISGCLAPIVFFAMLLYHN